MKKILFLIQSYPPHRSANVICDEKIIKALIATGNYEVHCLAYQYDKEPLFEEIDGLKVHRFRKTPFRRLFERAQQNENSGKSRLVFKLERIALRLKQVATIPIYPCYEPFITEKYAKEAIALYKKERFDLIISEYHGFDTFYAGCKVKKMFPEVKFMPILWDPFTGKQLARYLPKGYAERKNLNCELRLMKYADTIIAMKSSRKYHELYSKDKPYFDRYCFFDIPGIKKPESVSGSHEFIKENAINIVYSGWLASPDRDPRHIIEALNRSAFAAKVNLIFLCMGPGKAELHNLIRGGHLSDNIVVSGYVKPDELLRIYDNVDVFLNFGGSNPYMVPSKLFEYMSYGKPIISTYYIDDETSKKYLQKYPLALCLDEREASLSNSAKINTFFENCLGKRLEFATVAETYRENTTAPYAEKIQELLYL